MLVADPHGGILMERLLRHLWVWSVGAADPGGGGDPHGAPHVIPVGVERWLERCEKFLLVYTSFFFSRIVCLYTRILSLGHSLVASQVLGLGLELVAWHSLVANQVLGLGLGLVACQGIDPRGSCALQWPTTPRLEAALVLDDLDEARHCVDAQIAVFSSAPGLDHSLRIFHGLARLL